MNDLDRISKAIDKMTTRQQWTLAGFIEGYSERVHEELAEKEARRNAREKKGQ